MQTCSFCAASAAPDDQFCRSCGRSLVATSAPVVSASQSDATVRWSGTLPMRREPRSNIPLDTLFGQKTQVIIGRAPDCDVCLPHPSISRYHALLERRPDGLRLRDMNSVNGTFVG